jgi:TetR/AcrR family transcriptional regulator, transcriptional repressor for nem operon
MNQRKKQPERTRRVIMEAAGTEFSKHGYSGSGLGAIVARSELTKGALFHHFTDKRALALGWNEEILAPEIEKRWIAPLEGIGSLDALRTFCRARCLELAPGDAISALVALTAETAATDEKLGAAFERIFTHWRDAVSALLERGKFEGWIHSSIQPGTEAAFVVSAFAGFSITTCTRSDEGVRRTCASALEGYLETLRAQ